MNSSEQEKNLPELSVIIPCFNIREELAFFNPTQKIALVDSSGLD